MSGWEKALELAKAAPMKQTHNVRPGDDVRIMVGGGPAITIPAGLIQDVWDVLELCAADGVNLRLEHDKAEISSCFSPDKWTKIARGASVFEAISALAKEIR